MKAITSPTRYGLYDADVGGQLVAGLLYKPSHD